MAYTTINKSTDYFNTKLYTGTGSSNAITGVGHAPDLVWLKSRSANWDHEWYDNVRGAGYSISSVTSNAQGSSPQGVTAFGTDGFTVGTRSGANQSGQTYASWNWKANGSGSANTDGSITSTVSVNTTSGFSIVKYTGTGSNATIGHGLGSVPKMIIVKRLSNAENWTTYHTSLGNTKYIDLDVSNASVTYNMWQNYTPTSSVFYITTHNRLNASGDDYIAYCFAEKTGYSKFGSYTGNSNAHGTFIYLGFKPSFIMVKRTDTGNSYDNWIMYDNKRSGYNVDNDRVHADISDVENTDNTIDILSNGFKCRSNNSNLNGGTHIYMAFGQSLVGSNNVPSTAR